MKMTHEHYAHMARELDKIKPLIVAAIPEYRKAGLSDTRLHFDAYRKAGLIQFSCDTLYSYLNDEHIATALRAYFKTITN